MRLSVAAVLSLLATATVASFSAGRPQAFARRHLSQAVQMSHKRAVGPEASMPAVGIITLKARSPWASHGHGHGHGQLATRSPLPSPSPQYHVVHPQTHPSVVVLGESHKKRKSRGGTVGKVLLGLAGGLGLASLIHSNNNNNQPPVNPPPGPPTQGGTSATPSTDPSQSGGGGGGANMMDPYQLQGTGGTGGGPLSEASVSASQPPPQQQQQQQQGPPAGPPPDGS